MRNELFNQIPVLDGILSDVSMTTERVNNCIMSFTKVLDDIFSRYCSKEIVLKSSLKDGHNVKKHNDNKPWLDEKCIHLRKQYLHNLRLFNIVHSHHNRSALVTAKRNYKCYERKLKREYIRFEGNKLQYLKKKNPREFYKLFRNKKRNPPSSPDISEFYEHFKRLSLSDNNSQISEIDRTETDISISPELNNPITEAEIIKVIQRLKKEKSPGSDNLLNECFIEYNDFFTKYLVKLFNIRVVFSSGVFPSSWSEGIITPVFKKVFFRSFPK